MLWPCLFRGNVQGGGKNAWYLPLHLLLKYWGPYLLTHSLPLMWKCHIRIFFFFFHFSNRLISHESGYTSSILKTKTRQPIVFLPFLHATRKSNATMKHKHGNYTLLICIMIFNICLILRFCSKWAIPNQILSRGRI